MRDRYMERERGEKNRRDVVRGTTYYYYYYTKFTSLKVPRQCLLVLLVKVGWWQLKHFEVKKVAGWEVECWQCAAEGRC